MNRRGLASGVALAVAALTGAGTGGVPAASASEAPRVIVFPFEGFDLPAAMEKAPNQLGAVVELRFRTEGFDIAAATMLLRDMIVAVGCTAIDTACAKALADHFRVDATVIGKLVVKDGVVEANIRRYARDGTLVTDLREPLPTVPGERPAAYARLADTIVTGVAAELPGPSSVGSGPGDGGAGDGVKGGGGGRGFFSPPAITLGIGGVVLAGAAIPFAVLTAKASRDFEALGELRAPADFEAAEPIVRRGKLFARLTQVLLIAGGAVLGAGVITGLVMRRPEDGVSVSAAPLPGGALITVGVPWK